MWIGYVQTEMGFVGVSQAETHEEAIRLAREQAHDRGGAIAYCAKPEGKHWPQRHYDMFMTARERAIEKARVRWGFRPKVTA